MGTQVMRANWVVERENRILKQLLLDGFFWMNYSSRDCDGCSKEEAVKFTSLEEFYAQEESEAEWTDGSFSYTLADRREDGSFNLYESYTGGQWER